MILRHSYRLGATLAAGLVLTALPTLAAEPAAVSAPDLKPGDSWVFDRAIERGTSNFTTQRLDFKMEHVGGDTAVLGIKLDGSPVDFEDHVMGSDWSQRRLIDGKQTVTGRPFAFPMAIGKSWTSDYVDPTRHGLQTSVDHRVTYKVTGWEDVTTPAGSFHALKIESDDKMKAQLMAANGAVAGAVATSDGSTVVAHSDRSGPRTIYGEAFSTFYYAPEVKYWVKTITEDFNSESVRTRKQTDTLVAYKPAA
ncbi:MAG: hypothetical protein ACYDD1_16860 [Caulobacteraceae bacterium]